jgi:hypothetical protein
MEERHTAIERGGHVLAARCREMHPPERLRRRVLVLSWLLRGGQRQRHRHDGHTYQDAHVKLLSNPIVVGVESWALAVENVSGSRRLILSRTRTLWNPVESTSCLST